MTDLSYELKGGLRQKKTIMPPAIFLHFNSARQGLGLFLFALVYIPLLCGGAQRKGIK